MKQCPRCDLEIPEAAVVCIHCGYDYSGIRRFSRAISGVGCGGCLIWALLGLVVIGILGAIFPGLRGA